MHSIATLWLWIGFIVFVLVVLTIDMLVLGKKGSHRVQAREALCWTILWVTLALLFNVGLWFYLKNTYNEAFATQKALQFFTGYLIEESLSVDNLFVFIMIFTYFAVPEIYQRRILLYGVLGAIVMRLVMILSGTLLVKEFHWILYVFGAFLIFTGFKMFFFAENKKEFKNHWLIIFLKKHLRMTDELHGDRFFVRQNMLWYATPLFLVLVLIEMTDLVFALDSIPAIFAVTDDPFIIFTSNIFAIMGLRALYFLLADVAARFYLLKYGIALVLVFVGGKMLVAPWIEIPIGVALSVVAVILLTTVILSMRTAKRNLS